MMGRQDRDQRQLFYEFSLDEMIPAGHLLRQINVFATAVLADLHEQLKAFYSDLGRPSVDPELMIRMLLVGYCYAFVMSAGCVRKWRYTLLTAGSASSISTIRFRIIRRSR
jgi:transposase